MFEEREKTVLVNFRVTPSERKGLQELARMQNISTTRLIKLALLKYIEETKKATKLPNLF